jgi:hypothetical protein
MTPFQSLFAQHGDPYMPFPENAPRVDDLTSMPPQEISALPVELLAVLQHEINEALKRAKAAKARLDGALTIRYATRAAEERQFQNKDTGTVRFDDGDFTIVADLPKRVSWDQAKLAEMVEVIRDSKDDPAQYVDTSFKVPERKYTAWPEYLRRDFEPARTVRAGQLSVTLASQEVDQ